MAVANKNTIEINHKNTVKSCLAYLLKIIFGSDEEYIINSSYKTIKNILLLILLCFFISGMTGVIPNMHSIEQSIPVEIHIGESSNNPPNFPRYPYPENTSNSISLNPTLEVYVSDPNNDDMNISFYMQDGTLIGTQQNVSSDSISSMQWFNLSYSTTYSWYVVANDSEYHNTSETWMFTTTDRPSNQPERPPSVNFPPVADATASENVGFTGESLVFNASYSSDSDGIIVNYTWILNDEYFKYGKQVTHVFLKQGTYKISLKVTDDEGAYDVEKFIVEIVAGNNPPTQPIIQGPTTGHKLTTYSFSLRSTDYDNDSLYYIIQWGDGAINSSSIHKSGEIVNMSHQWDTYGIYEITVQANDGKTISESKVFTIFIDVLPVDTKECTGYLIDEHSDDTYNLFNNLDTSEITLTKLDNVTYLIDTDNDGKWNYAYSLDTGISIYSIYVYNKYLPIFYETPGFECIPFIFVVILFSSILWMKKKE